MLGLYHLSLLHCTTHYSSKLYMCPSPARFQPRETTSQATFERWTQANNSARPDTQHMKQTSMTCRTSPLRRSPPRQTDQRCHWVAPCTMNMPRLNEYNINCIRAWAFKPTALLGQQHILASSYLRILLTCSKEYTEELHNHHCPRPYIRVSNSMLPAG